MYIIGVRELYLHSTNQYLLLLTCNCMDCKLVPIVLLYTHMLACCRHTGTAAVEQEAAALAPFLEESLRLG